MSAANEQIFQLKKMGFSNEEVAVDLRYDKEIVDIVAPDTPSAQQAINRLDDIGDRAMNVLLEIMETGETERVRNDAAKFLAGLQYADGNYIITMDDDCQHQPKYIVDLYAEINKGYDVCYAN